MPSIRLSDLAKKLDARLYGDGNVLITAISSMESARAGDITFMVSSRYREKLARCQASAIIVKQEDLLFTNTSALVVEKPYLAYALIAQILDTTPKPATIISPSAVIYPSSQLGRNISVGGNAVIESNVILEDNVVIGPGCFIGKRTRIGEGSRLWANVTVYHEIEIGKNCLIQSGAVIGSDGFGYANDHENWVKIPQLGRVIVGDSVEIGACTTIDRGSLDDTIIGNGVVIDNQCQIAHNVMIGDNTAIAGGVVMGGSSKIGCSCMIGGACVINGHIEICDKVTITGMSMVTRSIKKPGVYSSGIPSQPNKMWRRTAAVVMNINNIRKRITAIERKIAQQN